MASPEGMNGLTKAWPTSIPFMCVCVCVYLHPDASPSKVFDGFQLKLPLVFRNKN
jgi:hypothetical protein